jgi:hypothetical protein
MQYITLFTSSTIAFLLMAYGQPALYGGFKWLDAHISIIYAFLVAVGLVVGLAEFVRRWYPSIRVPKITNLAFESYRRGISLLVVAACGFVLGVIAYTLLSAFDLMI